MGRSCILALHVYICTLQGVIKEQHVSSHDLFTTSILVVSTEIQDTRSISFPSGLKYEELLLDSPKIEITLDMREKWTQIIALLRYPDLVPSMTVA